MRLLGIDYGRKRVGVAVSDENGKFALAHSVLDNDGNLIPTLKKLCIDRKVEAIVVGESKNLDGKDNIIMNDINIFKDVLEEATGLRVYFEPEFFTSAEASRLQGENKMHDASAAALILKSYIERHDSKN